MENEINIRCNSVSSTSNKWTILNNIFPQSEVIYFSQVILIYIISIVSLVNISLSQENSYIWSNLLCICIGYMIPSPSINNKNKPQLQSKNESTILSDPPQ